MAVPTLGGFDFADICDDVVQRAGGETATSEDIQKIRRSLKLVLERWAAQRYNTWRTKTLTIGLSNVPAITLPKDVDDIYQMNVVSNDNLTNANESNMRRIGMEEYAQLASKNSTGQPSMFFLERTEPPIAHIYPVGRTDRTEQLLVYYIARPAEFDRIGMDVDAPARWLEALTLSLAADLARKRPMEGGGYNEPLIGRLMLEAETAIRVALDADRQRTKYRFRMAGGRR